MESQILDSRAAISSLSQKQTRKQKRVEKGGESTKGIGIKKSQTLSLGSNRV